MVGIVTGRTTRGKNETITRIYCMRIRDIPQLMLKNNQNKRNRKNDNFFVRYGTQFRQCWGIVLKMTYFLF